MSIKVIHPTQRERNGEPYVLAEVHVSADNLVIVNVRRAAAFPVTQAHELAKLLELAAQTAETGVKTPPRAAQGPFPTEMESSPSLRPHVPIDR